MQLKSIVAILACTLVKGLMASPLALRDSEEEGLVANSYIELWCEPATFYTGNMVYYGPSYSTLKAIRGANPEPAGFEKRYSSSCSSPKKLNCYESHEAGNEPCDQLVTGLQGDGGVSVPESPRQICYEGSSEKNAYCCVSWHNKIPGLTKADLYYPAYDSVSNLYCCA
jgi:hypothetical protein